jgi:hypothetical protein
MQHAHDRMHPPNDRKQATLDRISIARRLHFTGNGRQCYEKYAVNLRANPRMHCGADAACIPSYACCIQPAYHGYTIVFVCLFGALRHINTIMAISANGVCNRDATVITDVNQTCNIPSNFNSALGFCNEVDYSHQQKLMD